MEIMVTQTSSFSRVPGPTTYWRGLQGVWEARYWKQGVQMILYRFLAEMG
jgi:hypothetical protein